MIFQKRKIKVVLKNMFFLNEGYQLAFFKKKHLQISDFSPPRIHLDVSGS